MSTFQGTFEDIDLISADRFDGKNLKSTVFFLSHCHYDHMIGLMEPNELFLERLNEYGIYLYSSPVTTMMLQNWFPNYANKFCELPLESPTSIKIPSKDIAERYITVTPISAGHCPGSVMFLYETGVKTILYTGDFRINTKELHKYKPFYNNLGKLKHIDKMYLDTTFLNKNTIQFPTREQTLTVLCEVIDEWISKSKKHTIHFLTSAIYGPEFLYLGLWKKFNMPIHVREKVHEIEKYFPEMDKAITLNGDDTQIHSGCGAKHGTFCNSETEFVLKIKTCAMSFRNWVFNDKLIKDMGGVRKICFSCHASYEEICEFIDFLKPEQIEANVKPKRNDALEEMNLILAECMDKYKKPIEVIDTNEKNDLFDVNYVAKETILVNCDDFLNILDSPPKDFKRRRV